MGRIVLVTGVCQDLSRRFAQRLASNTATDVGDVDKVIGVDMVPPRRDLGPVQFVRADIRNPVIGKVIAAENVDTVVHLSVVASPRAAGGRALMKEINVIGSMQLLAACQRAPQVQQLVVKSSASVYGASPNDPAMFTEESAARRLPRSGLGKDSAEVEGYVRGFARRRPDVTVTMLRCADLIGAEVDSALTHYFTLPVVPTVLGFDARLQFLHHDDALGVLDHATAARVHGTFNVAGDGLIMLSQAIRRLSRPSVAVPGRGVGLLGTVLPRVRAADLSPETTALLTYGRGLDTTSMRHTLGFTPKMTTPEAFGEFAERHRSSVVTAERVEKLERQLTGALSRLAANARG